MEFLTLGLVHYLLLAAVLFCIGLVCVVASKHLIRMLLGVELMLNAVNINLVAFSNYKMYIDGEIFAMFIMAIAVCEVAVGLAILIAIFKNTGSINADEQDSLKG